MPSFMLSSLCLLILCSCSTFQVNTVPPPLPTAKLRVYVQPLSALEDKKQGKHRNWRDTSDDEFKDKQLENIRDYLEDLGYYEVVSEDDVQAALGEDGEQSLTRVQMEKDDWALAKNIGKALHADYVMVLERAKRSGTLGATDFIFTNDLINVDNGKKYNSSFKLYRNTGADYKDRRRGIRAAYREIFRKAKEDMLATAMRKADRLKEPGAAEAVHGPNPAVHPSEGEQKTTGSERIDGVNEEGLVQPASGRGSPKLVVYDLEASAQYKPAALIITEALREEIYQLKRFTIVNRENLEQILKEMALQQTGLIDEKEAVRTGKGLAASQVVTGRIGLLGKTFVLQAKRIDVESFATLSLTSAKFEQGREDNVFQQLPDFAKQLSGL